MPPLPSEPISAAGRLATWSHHSFQTTTFPSSWSIFSTSKHTSAALERIAIYGGCCAEPAWSIMKNCSKRCSSRTGVNQCTKLPADEQLAGGQGWLLKGKIRMWARVWGLGQETSPERRGRWNVSAVRKIVQRSQLADWHEEVPSHCPRELAELQVCRTGEEVHNRPRSLRFSLTWEVQPPGD